MRHVLPGVALAATLGASMVAVAIVAGWILAPRDGIPGLANLLSVHLAIAVAVLVPIAIVSRSRPLAVSLVVVAVIAVARFGGEWVSLPGGSAEPDLRVATWNLEFGDVGVATTLDGLRALDVDLVALQELTPEQAIAIEGDEGLASAFPHRALHPAPGVAGIGLLSRHPLDDPVAFDDPVSLRATMRVGDIDVVVHTVHPYPAAIEAVTPLRIPIGYEPTARDAALTRLRDRTLDDRRSGRPFVLLGDFNVAPTEPAYRVIAESLEDAHAVAGSGPGWTWRPSRLESLGIGLLRIDYVLTSALAATSSSTDCRRPGDHCLLEVGLELMEGRP